ARSASNHLSSESARILLPLKHLGWRSRWAAIGPGSAGRAQRWLTRSGSGVSSSIVTCQEAYTALDGQWVNGSNGILDRLGEIFGRSLYPKATTSIAKAKLFSELPGAYSYLTSTSKSAADIMKQAVLMNAMTQSMHTMAGSSGAAAIDVYAATRADLQTQNAYRAISHAAMKWVPILQIVLTVVFYAMFPVLFPLFLMPRLGPLMLRGYLMGFFYLAAWGPLYVVLNMILMLKAGTDATGAGVAGSGGLTMASSAGIAGVMDDVGVLAGYLVASIPFIAAGMAKGAMAIGGHAHAFLAPSQEAASEASREATTGNISLGTTNFDTHAYNSFQGNRWAVAGEFSGGSASFGWRQADGSVLTRHAGTDVMDVARSNLPVVPSLTQAIGAEYGQASTQAYSRGEQLSQTAAERFSQAVQQFRDFRTQFSRGETTENSYGVRDQDSISRAFSTIEQAAETMAARFGISVQAAEEAATRYYWTGQFNAGGSIGVNGGGTGASLGLTSMIGHQRNRSESERVAADTHAEEVKQFLRNFAEDNRWAEQREAFKSAAVQNSDGETRTLASAMTANFEQGSSLAREARKYYEQAERFEESQRLYSRGGAEVSTSISQALLEFAIAERERTPELYENFDPRSGADWNAQGGLVAAERDLMLQKFMQSFEERIEADANLRDLPSSTGIEGPRSLSQSSLERRFEKTSLRVDNNGLGPDPAMSNDEISKAYQERTESLDTGAAYVAPRLKHGEALAEQATSRVGGNPASVLDKAHRDARRN
ncbi:MAG TPA: conjugal transfer protein TraG N-terminal domain-containing protein, partial [Pedomonas sp.]|uniref:conjugal transfer protein TraG N-terminal domain-containing protein n=1 Tax=Pedomonas sp. TaxID=2976421 RepID=UPI002F40BFA4